MATPFRDALNSTLVTLKELTMQSLSVQPNQHPSRVNQILAQRKAACTHTQVTRLYGHFKCSICHNESDLGWVYRCVQDYGGQLPAWETGAPLTPVESGDNKIDSDKTTLVEGDNSHQNDNKEPDPEKTVVALKSWMEKAIAEGHYTPEQIAILRKQRQNVQDTIKNTETTILIHQKIGQRLSSVTAASPPAEGITEAYLDGLMKEIKGKGKSPFRASDVYIGCDYKCCAACR